MTSQHKSPESAKPNASHDEVASSPEKFDRLWREYEHLTDLYKYYLDLLLKTFIGFFAINATVITLVLSNTSSQPEIDWGLVPVMLFNLVLGASGARGVRLARQLQDQTDSVAARLDVGLSPHVEVLIGTIRGQFVLGTGGTLLLAPLLVVLRLHH